VKLITVIEDITLCDNVAVTLTLVKVEGAKALQISAVPNWVLVRRTKTQVNPAPVILVTVVLGDDTPSAATKARSSSLGELVEKAGVLTAVPGEAASREAVASMPSAARAGAINTLLASVKIGKILDIERHIVFMIVLCVHLGIDCDCVKAGEWSPCLE
jgi:hypothetical protein